MHRQFPLQSDTKRPPKILLLALSGSNPTNQPPANRPAPYQPRNIAQQRNSTAKRPSPFQFLPFRLAQRHKPPLAELAEPRRRDRLRWLRLRLRRRDRSRDRRLRWLRWLRERRARDRLRERLRSLGGFLPEAGARWARGFRLGKAEALGKILEARIQVGRRLSFWARYGGKRVKDQACQRKGGTAASNFRGSSSPF